MRLFSLLAVLVNSIRPLLPSSRGPARVSARRPVEVLTYEDKDPFLTLAKRMAEPDMRYRLILGISVLGDLVISSAKRCLALYGAPRGGKSGHLPTIVATWPGLVVWVTARGGEAVRTSGILRARMAGGICDLIDLPMDGSSTLAGLQRRGHTPITKDWEQAHRTAKATVRAALGLEGRFWSDSAALVYAALLLAGGLGGHSME